ncbi:hypothetical protein [Sphingomonas sp. KR3-1]|uniref:hypothetical protein n=1 Tax=Sphingomonas sp. KR3-1 TaxID=3156611 RepID=UPI0032B4319B
MFDVKCDFLAAPAGPGKGEWRQIYKRAEKDIGLVSLIPRKAAKIYTSGILQISAASRFRPPRESGASVVRRHFGFERFLLAQLDR